MNLLITRVLNKLNSYLKRIIVLIKIKYVKEDPIYEEDFVLPINDVIKEKAWSFEKIYNSNTYENFFNHNFLIFGNHSLDFANKSKKNLKWFASLCSEIDSKVVKNYRFIDWHLDALSGNRCDENKYYWNAFKINPIIESVENKFCEHKKELTDLKNNINL